MLNSEGNKSEFGEKKNLHFENKKSEIWGRKAWIWRKNLHFEFWDQKNKTKTNFE